MEIKLKTIELENFMGFYEAKVDFEEQKTVLFGKSGTGKSTIKDAWLWICGLDVDNCYPKFNNQLIEDLETQVKCRISIGDNEYSLLRKAKQKWKTNEEGVRMFNGFDASNFEVDGIPMNTTTYRNKICELFGLEKYEYIKYLCDINAFNNSIDYRKRREILFKIGDIAKKTEDLKQDARFDLIRSDLNKGLTVAEIIKGLNTTDKAIATEKKSNTIKITERQNDLLCEYDFDKLQEEQKELELSYRNKQSLLKNSSKDAVIHSIRRQIIDYKNQIAFEELNDVRKKNDLNLRLNEASTKATEISARTRNLEDELKRKVAEYTTIKSSEYAEEVCPICQRPIISSKSPEEQKEEFEANKTKKLKELAENIKKTKKTIADLKVDYEKAMMDVNNYDKSIWEFLPSITIDECKLKIKECEQQISELSTQDDDKQLVFELQVLEQRIKEINSKLAQKTIKESAESRIRQLEKANKELAKLEQTNILKRKSIETYIIDLVKIANTSINSMFNNISWNLFDTFNADAEKDIKEECEAMLKGKLYRQCSTGERLLVDFYTTLGLQKAFNVDLPIFFDEAQSSTFEKNCKQQLIELETRNTDITNIAGKRIKLKGTK